MRVLMMAEKKAEICYLLSVVVAVVFVLCD
jgi:hypothetical protein